MSDLIERLEAALEGSRELDEEIAQAIFPKLIRRHASWYIDDMRTDIEPFSTSLDAALTLVPEGHAGLTMRTNTSMPQVTIHCAPNSDRTNYYGEAVTVALALCIAALKAREAND